MGLTPDRKHSIQHGAGLFAVFVLLTVAIAIEGDGIEPVEALGVERNVPETSTLTETSVAPAVTTPPTTTPPTALAPTTVPPTTVPPTTLAPTTTTLPRNPVTYESIERIDVIRDFTEFTTQGPSRWRRSIDGLEELTIPSTADGTEQPVFWLPPNGDPDQPVLVVLHSWSSQYTQHAGIPFAMWAQENGWAMIAPEFRGKNDDPDAVGSDLAVQDVADAIDFAVAQDGVDADRVFVVGYSGGGMMALLVAGRHPDKVSAVSAWGPPHDLAMFYDYSARNGLGYWSHIGTACGGDPRTAGPAQDECATRSPSTYLATIREHQIPVFIGQGINDPFVNTDTAGLVFNGLAEPADRLTDDEIDALDRRRVPGETAEAVPVETHFRDRDPDPVFARQSADVLMVYFHAGHELVYNAAARWFASDAHASETDEESTRWREAS